MTLKKSQILAYGLYDAFSVGSNMPKKLMNEARDFIKRNTIALNPLSKQSVCCMRCLKAHLLAKSGQMDIVQEVIKNIPSLKDEEAGHHGYYMDQDEIIEMKQ